jgi:hypothetical protein
MYRDRARGAAMSQADVLSTIPVARSDRAVARSLAVLIEVPAVKADRMRCARTRVGGHVYTRPSWRGGPKRRLRREVRLAGCALLAMAPIVSACSLGWSSRPARVLACSIAPATPQDRVLDGGGDRLRPGGLPEVSSGGSSGVVVLSIEPAVLAPGADTEVPVVFPGYVLPDDSLEGSAHEGS